MADELKGRVFTQEEVSAILTRAVERRSPSAGELTYAELVDTARQAGIHPGAIDAAVQELLTPPPSAAAAVADDEVAREIVRRRWHSWRRFSLHFTVFVMFGVFFAAMDLHEGGAPNFYIPVLLWGIGIAAHFIAVLFPTVFPNPDRAEEVRRDLRKRHARGGPLVHIEPSTRVRVDEDRDEIRDEPELAEEKRARRSV